MRRCSALILAAGGSRRMGEPKQLLEWGELTLIEHVARTALAADFQEIVVVLGAAHEEIAAKIAGLGVRLVINSQWEEGLASSIRVGVEALSKAGGIMVLLGDQGAIQAQELIEFRERFEYGEAPVLASRYDGTVGPPAAFAPTMYPKLLELRGDQGAKELLQDPMADTIDMPSARVDLDTLQDYWNQQIPEGL